MNVVRKWGCMYFGTTTTLPYVKINNEFSYILGHLFYTCLSLYPTTAQLSYDASTLMTFSFMH